jgi:hypothetical protein
MSPRRQSIKFFDVQKNPMRVRSAGRPRATSVERRRDSCRRTASDSLRTERAPWQQGRGIGGRGCRRWRPGENQARFSAAKRAARDGSDVGPGRWARRSGPMRRRVGSRGRAWPEPWRGNEAHGRRGRPSAGNGRRSLRTHQRSKASRSRVVEPATIFGWRAARRHDGEGARAGGDVGPKQRSLQWHRGELQVGGLLRGV